MAHSDSDSTIEDLIQAAVTAALATTSKFELGKVVAFDDTAVPPRADVQLAVRGRRLVDGAWEQYERSILPDVPVGYPKAGPASMYWPLAVGDEVLVLLGDRDLDAAIENGEDVNDAPTPRRHSIMDAIAVPFAWSTKGSVPIAARASGGTVIEDALITLGAAATEWATTAEKCHTAFSNLVTWANLHTHSYLAPTGPSTSSTTGVAAPTKAAVDVADLRSSKVKVEE